MSDSTDNRLIFPPWANYLMPAVLLLLIGGAVYVPGIVVLAVSPSATAVGYQPAQPIPFSHAAHVGIHGIDCLYCHTTATTTAYAAIPSTQTCMNCHATVLSDSPLLAPLRESHETGKPIAWKKVHDLPDYVYFDHAAHVNKGVGCTTCHGPIATMDVVRQAEPLSMAWCLGCHRDPTPHLRPRDAVTRTDWDPLEATGLSQSALGPRLAEELRVSDRLVMENCSTCHR